MTNAQFKSSLQSELNADCISFRNPIDEVGEIGANTYIKFKYPVDADTKIWLQNRFKNGIMNDITDYSSSCIVLINTPAQNNKQRKIEFIYTFEYGQLFGERPFDNSIMQDKNTLIKSALCGLDNPEYLVKISCCIDMNIIPTDVPEWFIECNGKIWQEDIIEYLTPRNGFIVLQVLIGSYQPVFSDDDGLCFFNTEAEAQAEIQDCIDSVKEAVKNGDMSDEYTQEDYRIVAATLEGTKIKCTVDGDNYEMERTDDDYARV